MSLTPDQTHQETLSETLRREQAPMSYREVLGALGPAAVFVAVEVALLAAGSLGRLQLGPTLVCLAVFALAARVRIDIPSGYTVPTQLAFVPLMFTAPPALVPLLVLAVLWGSGLVDVARGRRRLERVLITEPANCAFALAPAAVFTLAHVRPQDAGAALLCGALMTQMAGDFALSSLRQRLEIQQSLSLALAELWVYGIDATLSLVAFVVAKYGEQHHVAVLSVVPLVMLLGVFARERRQRLQSMLELSSAYRGTAHVLGDVVEADDGYTGEHCRRVAMLALAVGDELGIDAERRRNLEFAALLHDVGKITVPKEIINKPGQLDAEEWSLIRSHTIEGQRMLNRIGGFMRDVGSIVRSHHERWDGRGYPDGLAGEEITLEARVIAACDTWNAMRTDRCYRAALSHERAMAELLAIAGTQLDARVVGALVQVVTGAESPEPEPVPKPSSGTRPEPVALMA